MAGSVKKRGRRPVRQRYVSSLDGLRALCALAVVGYHMRLSWLGGGLLGVTVLFVLSGYLVTAGLMREFNLSRGTISLSSFWRRRIGRLMPTVVVFIAVTGAVCALFDHALFTKMRPDIIPALLMVINWTKILSNESYFAAAGAPSPLTHFWSLAIEAQFYLVWPPVFYALMRRGCSRRRVRVGLVMAALASAGLMAALYVPGSDPSRPYYGTDTRAMSLLLGCWLAVAWPFDRMSARRAASLKGVRRYVVDMVGPVCLVVLVAMMLFTEGYSSFSYYGGILLCSIVTVGLVASLVPAGGRLEHVLSARPLEWVGKRSYAIYLWHYPILELLNPLKATTPVPWWKLLLELALILVVSDLSYRFVEVPFRSLGKKGRMAGRPAPAGSPQNRSAKEGKRTAPTWRAWLPMVPAAVITLVGGALLVRGLVTIEPVTAAGDNPDEKRVMQASLRKPLQDGVYDVVLIGDSVSLGANEQLNEAFPHGMIDSRGERQAPEALEVLEGYLDQGVVGDQVVISIGTNGILDTAVMDAFLKDVGEGRDLWFVNMRSPNAKDADNNALIDEYVAAYDNVHLIDWHDATQGHDEWLIVDGIHLTWEGREAYTRLVVDTMGYEVPDETNTRYGVMVLGDSVCLDAADELAKAYPHGLVDTADGRTTAAIVEAIEGYDAQDVMGANVIVCVGNEDLLSRDEVESVVQAVGDERSVWLVTARTPSTWCASNNKALRSVAEAHQNTQVIDWYEASAGHDDWFEDDGEHLSDKGAAAYVDAIVRGVGVEDEPQSPEDDEGQGLEGYDEEEWYVA